MIVATLALPIKGKSVLLGIKKKKIGGGLWNGFGGRVKPSDSSVENAACRELYEEVRLTARTLTKVGVVKFLLDEVPTWEVHIFLVKEWEGTPTETGEMGNPKWFFRSQIPYSKMLPADRHWLPLVLHGHSIQGVARYNAQATELRDFTFSEKSFV